MQMIKSLSYFNEISELNLVWINFKDITNKFIIHLLKFNEFDMKP